MSEEQRPPPQFGPPVAAEDVGQVDDPSGDAEGTQPAEADERDLAAMDEPAPEQPAAAQALAALPVDTVESQADGESADQGPLRRLPRPGLPAIFASAPVVTLTALVSLLVLAFLLIEPTPRWLALFGSAAAVLAMHGTLRSMRRRAFEDGEDTTPYLFLPALFVLAMPVFLEYNVRGYWAVPAALLAGAGFGLVAAAEVASVRQADPARSAARFIAAGATYVVAFALFSLTYRFDLDLQQALVATALASLLLAVELLRDGEVHPLETLVFAAVTALVVVEVRWTLHFLPLDGYLAGLTLLLAFYFVTGVLHSHLTRHLDRVVTIEYATIVAVGVAMVAGARAAGLA